MYLSSTGPTAKKQQNRTVLFLYKTTFYGPFFAVLASVLCLSLTGCSGFSAPGNSSTSSKSVAALTVSSALSSGTVGSIYKDTLNVSGGTSPYKFTIASGQLPAGLSLNGSSGTISGTPSAAGTFSFSISVSDENGLSKQQALQLPVATAVSTNGQTKGSSFSNLQENGGWSGAAQGPPDFVNCSPSPCDGISFSLTQGIKSPSMSGSATEYSLGGTALYGDGFFNNHLIGDLSSQGLPDKNHTLVPAYHDFTYDVYFYGTNLELSQALEFDVNQFFDNLGLIWGHECRIAGGHEWDVWDNVSGHWVPTGVACNPVSNAWNHLTIQVQRTSSNQLLYQSITLNGVTSTLDQSYDPGTSPGWNGITINYQMDGNYEQSAYSIYLDQLTFTYE